MEQDYLVVPDDGGWPSFDYTAPAFGVERRLVFDGSGLVLDYPGLAVRVA